MFPLRTSVPNREVPSVVIALIVANVAVYLVQAGLPADPAAQFIRDYGLVPARYTNPAHGSFSLLPILTNTFLHGGIWHLALNMWTLWLFGRALEEKFGALLFAAFYLACGAVASLTHLAFNLGSPIPALGASGAIAGVLGGFTLLHSAARITLVTPIMFFPLVYTLPAVAYTVIWFAFQIVPGLIELDTGGHRAGIAWWAHIGGLGAGLVLTVAITHFRRERAARPGRLDVSKQSGHRPQTIEIGAWRDDALNTGVQRPNVIRLGAARKREPPSGRARRPQVMDILRRVTERVAITAARRTSSVPITHRANAREPAMDDDPIDRPATNIWKR